MPCGSLGFVTYIFFMIPKNYKISTTLFLNLNSMQKLQINNFPSFYWINKLKSIWLRQKVSAHDLPLILGCIITDSRQRKLCFLFRGDFLFDLVLFRISNLYLSNFHLMNFHICKFDNSDSTLNLLSNSNIEYPLMFLL